MSKIELGMTAKDQITGFKGVVTGISIYIHGCRHIHLQPGVDKDGKSVDGQWFDEPALVQVGKKIHKIMDKPKSKRAGGPSIISRSK